MSVNSEAIHPILVTGAAGQVGSVGRQVVRLLRQDGLPVRAMVRRMDERADALRDLGAEVVCGDLTELGSLRRAMEGCRRLFFGMSISPAFLEATVNTAAVALDVEVDAFVNLSQMTVAQMSTTESTESPQQRLHWLAEQALSWSGLPVVTVRPTVFMEGLFLLLGGAGIRERDEVALPAGRGRTAPIAAADVALAVATILQDPASHVGRAYNLAGPRSSDLENHAEAIGRGLGRHIGYRDAPPEQLDDALRSMLLPEHVVRHISTMMTLHRQGRYDRTSGDFELLTGRAPIDVEEFARRNVAAFSR